MSKKITGKITFVNHEKEYAMVEYEVANKKKNVRASFREADPKLRAKRHLFAPGDHVSFELRADGRGDRMTADNLTFLFNSALDNILHLSRTTNKFSGYLKETADGLFVKEVNSYLFFPLHFSNWELMPAPETFNEPVQFKLQRMGRPEKVHAELLNKKYKKEFLFAVNSLKSKKILSARVTRLTPHSAYLSLQDAELGAKLPAAADLKLNDEIQVRIIHIADDRLVVERVPK